MSDIFISYSKADRAMALKLSAFLEAEGWSVWWDKSLGAADLYRDEIMKQLAAARAVITIWSPNSIKSHRRLATFAVSGLLSRHRQFAVSR
jgi:TIR domain